MSIMHIHRRLSVAFYLLGWCICPFYHSQRNRGQVSIATFRHLSDFMTLPALDDFWNEGRLSRQL
jgi:hypothetical protein